jgi:hypothetical protein
MTRYFRSIITLELLTEYRPVQGSDAPRNELEALGALG